MAELIAEAVCPHCGADPDTDTITDLLATRWVGYAMTTAAELGIADALADGPRTAAAVAAATGADEVGVTSLLRALATIGLVRQLDGDELFESTAAGAALRADAPGSLRDAVLVSGGERFLRGWMRLTERVRAGRAPISEQERVADPFDRLAALPEAQDRFHTAMADATGAVAQAVADAYDYTGIGSIVDVGGGYGTLLPPILRRYPDMTGVVFDRPYCRTGAERVIADAGLADRYRFAGGSFFGDPLPPGADAYVLKSVLHDWDDERAVEILRSCRAAMGPRSRLLVVEVVMPDRTESTREHRQKIWADLTMFVASGRGERTERRYAALLEAAGMRIARIVPTATLDRADIIEAVAA
ncbi:methyltransferase [Nocardia wallacei]|uniref:methyltransferase n=1 Tax=Nocardia wallacei TaxID=480035 RepID=UPI0024556C96|nr:methyltransferase [Nocardia wallacei]